MSQNPAPDSEGAPPASGSADTPDEALGTQPDEGAASSGYVGMGAAIGIGAGIGFIFGTLLDNLALGLACGAGLGVVAGAIIEARRSRA